MITEPEGKTSQLVISLDGVGETFQVPSIKLEKMQRIVLLLRASIRKILEERPEGQRRNEK